MKSKAVALFLSLSLATTLAACGASDTGGGEEGGDTSPSPTPASPENEQGSTTSPSSSPVAQGGEEGEDGEEPTQGGEEGEEG